jgi:hypothetical protein
MFDFEWATLPSTISGWLCTMIPVIYLIACLIMACIDEDDADNKRKRKQELHATKTAFRARATATATAAAASNGHVSRNQFKGKIYCRQTSRSSILNA